MIVIYSLIYTYTFYFAFLAVMLLKAKWDALPLPMKVLSAPGVIIAYFMDIAFNYSIATILFLQGPQEFTFTARLSRYKTEGGLRGKVATWLCVNLLDPAEIGGHCTK